jgi:hypothetical protein
MRRETELKQAFAKPADWGCVGRCAEEPDPIHFPHLLCARCERREKRDVS